MSASGYVQQRQRMRTAIVDAATKLLLSGEAPSLSRIAGAAAVSKRTISVYFPRLDDLLVVAMVGVLRSQVEKELGAISSRDHREKARQAIQAICRAIAGTIPLGRKVVKLTVEVPWDDDPSGRLGQRHIHWIESALDGVRPHLPAGDFEELVSALATLVSWKSFIFLTDVRGMSPDEIYRYTTKLAERLIGATYHEAGLSLTESS